MFFEHDYARCGWEVNFVFPPRQYFVSYENIMNNAFLVCLFFFVSRTYKLKTKLWYFLHRKEIEKLKEDSEKYVKENFVKIGNVSIRIK